jgi:MFS transporter, PAT family, beta-lactamase induction signal transducer AmpG
MPDQARSAGARFREAIEVYADRRILTILCLGFSSGLPAPLVFSNLSIWLSDTGVSRTEIGLFALVATPYAINFLWAPLIDRLPLPGLTDRFGRRRGWALLTQVVLIGAILVMASTDPATNLPLVALAALLVTSASATQDIVIDAYRIDILEPERYGAGSAAAIWGWHLGGTFIGGAGGLYLAHAFGWHASYAVLAAGILVGMTAILASPEPPYRPPPDTIESERRAARFIRGLPFLKGGALADAVAWLYTAAVAPFVDFARRNGWLLILIFVFVFRLGDALLGRMSGVFYREVGFSLTEIADVAKIYGFWANGAGIVLGGVLARMVGIPWALMISGLATAATNLTYTWLAVAGQHKLIFILAVMSDSFTSGLVTVAFVAYLSGLCNQAYTATQYALLASLGNLARIWFSGASGWMVDGLDGDWALFFVICAVVALAGMPLLLVLMRVFPQAPVQAEARAVPVSGS